MLQFQEHLFRAVFFPNDVMCSGHYDVIYHPFPISSQYLKMWGLTALWFSMISVHIDGHDRIYFDMADISVSSTSPTSRFT